MLIRTIVLYLNYLRMRIKYSKQIWFRGFSVICVLKGSEIQINPTGVKEYISFPILSAI